MGKIRVMKIDPPHMICREFEIKLPWDSIEEATGFMGDYVLLDSSDLLEEIDTFRKSVYGIQVAHSHFKNKGFVFDGFHTKRLGGKDAKEG